MGSSFIMFPLGGSRVGENIEFISMTPNKIYQYDTQ